MKPPRRPTSDSGRPGGDRPRQGDDRPGPRGGAPGRGAAPGADRAGPGRPRFERSASGPDAPRRDDKRTSYQSADRAKPDRDQPGRANHDRSNPDRRPPSAASGPRPSRPPPPPGPQAERPRSERPRPENPRPEGERSAKSAAPRPQRAVLSRPRAAPEPAERAYEQEPRGPAAREAPSGSLWLYGTHAVAAALANPARRLRRLLLTEEAEANVAERLSRPWAVQVERADRARLDQLLGAGAIHQGAALLVDPLQPPSLQSAVARPGPVLVLDQVGDPRNVGAILRAAAAFGVAAVITQDRNAPEETGALAKAASGALESVPFLRAVNIARTLVALRAAGFWVVGLDAGGGILSGAALAERRVALVLGNEGVGLRRLTRETCDEVAGIAMPGLGKPGLGRSGGTAQLESLNVSAATAVALYELVRGR